MKTIRLTPDSPPSVNILESTIPPEGYRFERLLALSYSLEPRVAIALLAAAFGRTQDYDPDQPMDWDEFNPLERRAFVKKVLSRSLFLVQHGEPKDRTISTEMQRILEDRIFQVAVSGRGTTGERSFVNFHPKLLLIEFIKGPRRWFRIYIGSRNLSLASAREAGVILDIPPEPVRSRRNSASAITTTLQSYLAAIQRLALKPAKLGQGIARPTKELAIWKRSLRSIRGRTFALPPGIIDVGLQAQWPGSRPLSETLARDLHSTRQALIISPWIDVAAASLLAATSPDRGNLTLWCLRSEWGHLAALATKKPKVVIDGTASAYEESSQKEGSEIGFELRLHAKTFALDQRQGGILWLGSANMTRPGLGLSRHPAANFELMLRLKTQRPATQLFGRLNTASLSDSMLSATTQEAESAPATPFIWIRGSWIRYPRLLRLELSKPRISPDFSRYCRWLVIDGRDEAGDLMTLARVPWAQLWKTGVADIRTDGTRRPDAGLVLRSSGATVPPITLLVPIPDQTAEQKVTKLLSTPVPLELALERLLSIQQGIGGTRGRPKNVMNGSRAERYLSGIRLETLYLRLVEDESEDTLMEVEDVIRCIVSPNTDDRTRRLALDLKTIARHARTARRLAR